MAAKTSLVRCIAGAAEATTYSILRRGEVRCVNWRLADQSWEQVEHLILPVVTLSLIPMGVVSRLVRANVLEILSQEFVGTLRAKGLFNRRVLYHTLKNAAPSTLALMGLQFGYLLAGSILVETVFNWPGSGGLMNLAIFRRDVPVLSATIVVLATIFVVINILVDVLQALIDPRMRR
jgi:peptide/nickel transport system permease protein